MKVTPNHHSTAESAFSNGKSTLQVQGILIKDGLTKAQANSACRTARKHLGLYKEGSGKSPANDADKQASMKTEVSQDL